MTDEVRELYQGEPTATRFLYECTPSPDGGWDILRWNHQRRCYEFSRQTTWIDWAHNHIHAANKAYELDKALGFKNDETDKCLN